LKTIVRKMVVVMTGEVKVINSNRILFKKKATKAFHQVVKRNVDGMQVAKQPDSDKNVVEIDHEVGEQLRARNICREVGKCVYFEKHCCYDSRQQSEESPRK
jgi:hypothetical protein